VSIELLTVGESFRDLVFVGLPHLPRSGEELKSGRFVETIGGGAAITAVAAARLGLRVAMISALTTEAERELRRERILVTNLRRAHEPAAVTVALSTTRDRSFVTYNGVNMNLQRRLLAAIARRPAAHVHFAFSPDRCGVWTRLVRRLRSQGVSTSWDLGWDPALPRRSGFTDLAGEVDVLFMNEIEAALYARARRSARTAVVKLGSRGSRWTAEATRVSAPAPRVRAVDTTGAGDAFNGGFLFALLRGLSPRECLRLGNFVGARSTLAPGGIAALPARPAGPARPARPARSARR
jgi:sugar/nucleoside kinase (ribokinase family)